MIRKIVVYLFMFLNGAVLASGDEMGAVVPFYYDVRTGNATIDTTNVTGGVLTGYDIGIPERHRPESVDWFLVNNWTPFMNSPFATGAPWVLGESNFSGVTPGVYSLGNVFPPGLTEEGLLEYFGPTDPFVGYSHSAVGALGSNVDHKFEPLYMPSPFTALNDSNTEPRDPVDWATEMKLEYDPNSGNLAIDTRGENGGSFFVYGLQVANDLFVIDEFTPITSLSVVRKPGEIGEVSFDPIPSGYYSLGSVLPTGLSELELSDSLRIANFVGQPTLGASAIDVEGSGIRMSLAIVPEPSAGPITIMALAIVFSIERRRRTV